MKKIDTGFSKLLISILFVICIKCSCSEFVANKTDFHSFDFEQMKIDLFTQSKHNELSEETISKNAKCLFHLAEIGSGLIKMQKWAIEIIDTWGKVPSVVLNGNLYEFGGFSECFHIKRNNELYNSKYCLGQIVIDLKKMAKPESLSSDVKHSPNIVHMNNLPEITPLIILQQPKVGTAIKFGLCVPASCSLDFLQKLLKLDKIRSEKLSIQLLENTCQFEEQITELKTIDCWTIGLLSVVAFLVLLSTGYDIYYTVYNREKSQALLAFSFYSNGMKLLSYEKSKSPDMMHCLHGIRALSTSWVVLGHTFFINIKLPIRNIGELGSFISRYHNMVILSALISVDTFFVLSGLLTSMNMLKHFEKTKGRINVLMLYFHRYLRLTPLLGVTVLFSISLFRFMGNGPIWPSTLDFLSQQCERNWWTTLLYIQNYVNRNDVCFGHSWYLSVDMQLFLIAPAVVYLLYRYEKPTLVVLIGLVFGCIGCILAIHQKYGIKGSLNSPNKMAKVYIPTHTRYAPWLIGIIAGYIFFKASKRTIRIPRMFNLFAWALSLTIMVAVIFSNYPLLQTDSKATPVEYGTYDAVSRIVWSIALCYIIFACVHNSGGPVNWFLGHPLWQPLSRLSYAIYILHFLVVLLNTASMKISPYFSELSAFHLFLGNYVLVVFISIIATLAFESPIVVIEKILFGQKEKKKHTSEPKYSNGVQTDSANVK